MKRITIEHGAGGSVMQDLIKNYILEYLGGSEVEVPLEALDDAAVTDDIVLHTDSHTIKPLFFPGGDIGRLAISGTINDIAVLGAETLALSSGFILEEGFLLSDLERILKSMAETCVEAEVHVITGDTKVLEKGALEQLIINTSGIGRRCEALEANIATVRRYRDFEMRWLLDSNLKNGDKIILSGTVGDHGVALLSFRDGYGFESGIVSDVKPLNKMIAQILETGGIVAMKDPTRGGIANALNEWSEKSKIGLLISEENIPIRTGVRAACEMLGIDPLEIGNEGKIIIGVIPEKEEEVLDALKETKEGRDAQVIGEVSKKFEEVVLETELGGKRILSPPAGDPIPRIC